MDLIRVNDTIMPHGRNNSKLWNFTKKYQQPRDREKHSDNITSKCWLNGGIPKGKASLKATYPYEVKKRQVKPDTGERAKGKGFIKRWKVNIPRHHPC